MPIKGCKFSLKIGPRQVQKWGKEMHKKRDKRPKKGYKIDTKRGT